MHPFFNKKYNINIRITFKISYLHLLFLLLFFINAYSQTVPPRYLIVNLVKFASCTCVHSFVRDVAISLDYITSYYYSYIAQPGRTKGQSAIRLCISRSYHTQQPLTTSSAYAHHAFVRIRDDSFGWVILDGVESPASLPLPSLHQTSGSLLRTPPGWRERRGAFAAVARG